MQQSIIPRYDVLLKLFLLGSVPAMSLEILYSTTFKDRILGSAGGAIFMIIVVFGWNYLLNQDVLDPSIPVGLPPFTIVGHIFLYLVAIIIFYDLIYHIINYKIIYYNSDEDIIIIETRISRDKIIHRKDIDCILLVNKEGQKMKQIYIKPNKTKKSWILTRLISLTMGEEGEDVTTFEGKISLAMGEGEDVTTFLEKLQDIYPEMPLEVREPID